MCAVNTLKRVLWVIVLLLAPFPLYVASYYVLVEPGPVRCMTGQGPWPRVPNYRFGNWSVSLYAPILGLDQKLFPQRWLWTDKDTESLFLRYGVVVTNGQAVIVR